MKFLRTQQGGQGVGYVVEDATGLGSTLAALVFFPREGLRRRRFRRHLVTEHMRVPGYHFGGNRFDDAAIIEQPALFGHAGVEDDLEQQIAQLVSYVVPVLLFDRAGHFIGFLDRVGRYGREGLFLVPWAAAWTAQPPHDLQKRFDISGRTRFFHFASEGGQAPRGKRRLRVFIGFPVPSASPSTG